MIHIWLDRITIAWRALRGDFDYDPASYVKHQTSFDFGIEKDWRNYCATIKPSTFALDQYNKRRIAAALAEVEAHPS